jgi:hypothetical protein
MNCPEGLTSSQRREPLAATPTGTGSRRPTRMPISETFDPMTCRAMGASCTPTVVNSPRQIEDDIGRLDRRMRELVRQAIRTEAEPGNAAARQRLEEERDRFLIDHDWFTGPSERLRRAEAAVSKPSSIVPSGTDGSASCRPCAVTCVGGAKSSSVRMRRGGKHAVCW